MVCFVTSRTHVHNPRIPPRYLTMVAELGSAIIDKHTQSHMSCLHSEMNFTLQIESLASADDALISSYINRNRERKL